MIYLINMMTMNNIYKRLKRLRCFLTVVGFMATILVSCSEDLVTELADNGNDAAINFYNGAEAIRQHVVNNLQPRLSENNYVFINDSVPNASFPNFPSFPNNIVGTSAPDREYPNKWFEAIGGNGVYGFGQIYFMRIMQGQYRFIYTSLNKVFLQDLELDIRRKTYNTLYLVESPESDRSYTIVHAPVELQGAAGKVRVQVVHLATDLEPVDVVQIGADGETVIQSVAENLGFADYSSYVDLDVVHADENKALAVQFRRSGTGETILAYGIPATSGSVYTLLVQGFAREAERFVKTGESEYVRVDVAPSLRITSRRMY